ncbi:putative aldouronate transport system permease protein [Anaerotaenia torta]|uniref:ABC transporter permease n=1 Tax=Anaerotaenia torta TaxID=433293 RepID=UPI003D18FEB5
MKTTTKSKSQPGSWARSFKRHKELWIITVLALVWATIFCYIPLAGNVISFFDYTPGKSLTDSTFVGFKYFIQFFKLPDMGKIFRNTLVISGLGMTVGFAAPIIFALLLNEVKNVLFKRTIQTISYMPYFISWVVMASIMYMLLGSEGTINSLLLSLGFTDRPVAFFNEADYFWTLLTAANIWKGIGWSAIVYMSAIAGVDQELYEAASVDGINRFGKVWHITIPSIRPTIVLLFILGLGGILNAGYEAQLLIGTPLTKDVYETIDTYVYRYGLQLGRYSFSTAVGLFKSIIGFILVIASNKVSEKVMETKLF